MSRIAVIIDEGLKENAEIKGKLNRVKAHIDEAVTKASVDDFDALLIPGGESPDYLRAHEEAVDFVREFVQQKISPLKKD